MLTIADPRWFSSSFPLFIPTSSGPSALQNSPSIHSASFSRPFYSLNFSMEIAQVYAAAAGGIFIVLIFVNLLRDTFIVLIFVNLRRGIVQRLETFSPLKSKHLTYPLIRRHRFLGPWNLADVLTQLGYIAVNVFCLSFKVRSIRMAGLRAANLSLINLIPPLAGFHLSFLADLLRVSLSTFRQIHRSAGVMSVFLLLIHIATIVGYRTSLPLHVPENLWAVIVRSVFYPL
jgi:hypothetical protein